MTDRHGQTRVKYHSNAYARIGEHSYLHNAAMSKHPCLPVSLSSICGINPPGELKTGEAAT
jgi:hypothetical protein